MNVFGNTDGDNNAITDSDLTYDKRFKQLLSNKKFFVPILKNVVPEYKKLALDGIEKLVVPLTKQGGTEVNPRAYDSEDVGKGEETTVSYDVLVGCKLPNKKDRVYTNIFFDLEMQRKNNPGYSIPRRGVYYCSRLISRQIAVLGKEQYDQLIPVYSVWILINGIPDGLENSVYTVGLSGSFDDVSKNGLKSAIEIGQQIDLIHLCLIYLSENFKVEEGQSDLVKYLQSVFTRNIGKACNPYREYSQSIEKEVDDMMTFKESFELMAEQRGRVEGRLEGRVKMLQELGKSDAEIIQYLTTILKPSLTFDEAKALLKSCQEG